MNYLKAREATKEVTGMDEQGKSERKWNEVISNGEKA
jgi:hypothetical protein